MSRFTPDALDAPHTQRHLDAIPQRGTPFQQAESLAAKDAENACLTAALNASQVEIARLTAEVERLSDEAADGWRYKRRSELLSSVMRAMKSKTLPGPVELMDLSSFAIWEIDWPVGKQMQRELGGIAIPYKSECEQGAGFWKRINSHPVEKGAPLDSAPPAESPSQ